MSAALRPSETRSLALLLEVAASAPEGPALLRAQAARLPRRMRIAAEEAASAWERGDALPAPFAGGDPTMTSAQVSAAEELRDAVDRDAFRSAMAPVLTASFALVACSAALAFTAGPVHALLSETAPVLGGPEPGALLSVLAAHPAAVLASGLIAGLATAIAFPLGRLVARTERGGRVVARIPGFRSLQSALASHEFASRVLGPLGDGRPAHEAASEAASGAASPWARRRLAACAARLACGEPPSDAFADPALPHLAPLRLSLLAGDGGIAAATESVDRSALAAREAAVRVGRGLAGAALLLTAAAAILLVGAVLLPLATFGAPSP